MKEVWFLTTNYQRAAEFQVTIADLCGLRVVTNTVAFYTALVGVTPETLPVIVISDGSHDDEVVGSCDCLEEQRSIASEHKLKVVSTKYFFCWRRRLKAKVRKALAETKKA